MSKAGKVVALLAAAFVVSGALTAALVAEFTSTSPGCPAQMVEVFLSPQATGDEVTAVGREIQSQRGLKEIRYVSQFNGYIEFEGRFGRTDVNVLGPSDIPPSFRVIGRDAQADARVQAATTGLSGVLTVTIDHPQHDQSLTAASSVPVAPGTYYLDLSDLVHKVGAVGPACRVGHGTQLSMPVPTGNP